MMKRSLRNDNAYYEDGTPAGVVYALYRARLRDFRIHICYGDPDTGADWKETYDVEGYVGLTTGKEPIPILVHNKRSLGGAAISTSRIVKVTRTAANHEVLYQHERYHVPVDPACEALDGRVKAVITQLQV